MAHRARLHDTATAEFLRAHPGATVVALGEGLETQFWRVDNGTVRWLSVDLPEALALRRSVLPHGSRQPTLACSATDPRWTEHVGGSPVLIVAQGLLMYLSPADTASLIRLCAGRFPRGVLLADTIPRWLTRPARRYLTRGTFRFPFLYGAHRPSFRPLPLTGSRWEVTERHIGPYTFGPRAVHRPLLVVQRSRLVRKVFMPVFVRVDLAP
ncbi:class I SAM-dependent methyltransferase [Streptomyces netropsis]